MRIGPLAWLIENDLAVAAAIHNQGFITASKKMTAELVTDVESLCVSAQQPLHPEDQVSITKWKWLRMRQYA
jgi:protein involved in polysaccharide export with SLBB domain